MIFKAPKIISKWQIPFYYVQKDLRLNHDKFLRPKIEPWLREKEVWFLVDKDPKDWENVVLN